MTGNNVPDAMLEPPFIADTCASSRPVVIYDKKRVVQANELVNLTIHFTSDLPPSLGTDVKPMMLR